MRSDVMETSVEMSSMRPVSPMVMAGYAMEPMSVMRVLAVRMGICGIVVGLRRQGAGPIWDVEGEGCGMC